MVTEDPYRTPVAPVEVDEVEVAEELLLATLDQRAGAFLLDSIIVMALSYAALKALAVEGSAFGAVDLQTRFLRAGITLAIFIGLNAHLLIGHGQTIGKAALRIRMVSADGRRASWVRLGFARALPYFLLSFGDVPSLLPGLPLFALRWMADHALAWRGSRRTLHDLLADTIVVKA